jgi:hypothetical protein
MLWQAREGDGSQPPSGLIGMGDVPQGCGRLKCHILQVSYIGPWLHGLCSLSHILLHCAAFCVNVVALQMSEIW